MKNTETNELTKRELIAAMALQGLLSDHTTTGDYPVYATDAVRFADALIEALNEGGDDDSR